MSTMAVPTDLTLKNIREYFLARDNYTVSNFELVKHFKKHLTDPSTKAESRKKFKTYVNILSTIKNEGDEKFLVLRKKYYHDCPPEEPSTPMDSNRGGPSHESYNELPPPMNESNWSGQNYERRMDNSPRPPPYKAPPVVSTNLNYKMCVDEFKFAMNAVESNSCNSSLSQLDMSAGLSTTADRMPDILAERASEIMLKPVDIPKKQIEVFEKPTDAVPKPIEDRDDEGSGNVISVREATRKFNRIASQDDSNKICSPNSKQLDRSLSEDANNNAHVVISSHHKSKEWMVSASKSNYQELAKLASEHPELVHFQDATTTALHFAAKNGNENVVKLIAGTHRCSVNVKSNGGYTALHIAILFNKEGIYELLRTVYKADCNALDYNGLKPAEYRKTNTSSSAATYNRIKNRKKHIDKDNKFLRIGSLNVRVKKTTASFSNFLGVGTTSHYPSLQEDPGTAKQWGSADNIQQESEAMPPPKTLPGKKRAKRHTSATDFTSTTSSPVSQHTPRSSVHSDNSQFNEESDSDTACGFDSNWKHPPLSQ